MVKHNLHIKDVQSHYVATYAKYKCLESTTLNTSYMPIACYQSKNKWTQMSSFLVTITTISSQWLYSPLLVDPALTSLPFPCVA